MTGKVFAMLVKEEPVGKLPAARCVEVVVTGAARPFESGGRRLRESVSIRQPDARGWLELARKRPRSPGADRGRRKGHASRGARRYTPPGMKGSHTTRRHR